MFKYVYIYIYKIRPLLMQGLVWGWGMRVCRQFSNHIKWGESPLKPGYWFPTGLNFITINYWVYLWTPICISLTLHTVWHNSSPEIKSWILSHLFVVMTHILYSRNSKPIFLWMYMHCTCMIIKERKTRTFPTSKIVCDLWYI